MFKLKKRRIFLLIITLILTMVSVITLCGCGKTFAYRFIQDVSEIKSISIVQKKDSARSDALDDYELIKEIEDTDIFLEEFNQIKFGKYIIGDPTHIGPTAYAICVMYYNDIYEMINYYAQARMVDERNYFGIFHCDKDEFNEFIEKWISQ